MKKVKPHNPSASTHKPINNYFVDKNWVTIDRNGISVHSYLGGAITTQNKEHDINTDSVEFIKRKNKPRPVKPLKNPYKYHEQPLCDQYKCAESCNKDCARMNCYAKPHLKK